MRNKDAAIAAALVALAGWGCSAGTAATEDHLAAGSMCENVYSAELMEMGEAVGQSAYTEVWSADLLRITGALPEAYHPGLPGLGPVALRYQADTAVGYSGMPRNEYRVYYQSAEPGWANFIGHQSAACVENRDFDGALLGSELTVYEPGVMVDADLGEGHAPFLREHILWGNEDCAAIFGRLAGRADLDSASLEATIDTIDGSLVMQNALGYAGAASAMLDFDRTISFFTSIETGALSLIVDENAGNRDAYVFAYFHGERPDLGELPPDTDFPHDAIGSELRVHHLRGVPEGGERDLLSIAEAWCGFGGQSFHCSPASGPAAYLVWTSSFLYSTDNRLLEMNTFEYEGQTPYYGNAVTADLGFVAMSPYIYGKDNHWIKLVETTRTEGEDRREEVIHLYGKPTAAPYDEPRLRAQIHRQEVTAPDGRTLFPVTAIEWFDYHSEADGSCVRSDNYDCRFREVRLNLSPIEWVPCDQHNGGSGADLCAWGGQGRFGLVFSHLIDAAISGEWTAPVLDEISGQLDYDVEAPVELSARLVEPFTRALRGPDNTWGTADDFNLGWESESLYSAEGVLVAAWSNGGQIIFSPYGQATSMACFGGDTGVGVGHFACSRGIFGGRCYAPDMAPLIQAGVFPTGGDLGANRATAAAMGVAEVYQQIFSRLREAPRVL